MSQKTRVGEATQRITNPLYATSRMTELMELAAARLMRPNLGSGATSIPIEMKMTHVAPATVGGLWRAVAAYDGTAGRLHRFRINVFDETGLIGSAEHTRAVVATLQVA